MYNQVYLNSIYNYIIYNFKKAWNIFVYWCIYSNYSNLSAFCEFSEPDSNRTKIKLNSN